MYLYVHCTHLCPWQRQPELNQRSIVSVPFFHLSASYLNFVREQIFLINIHHALLPYKKSVDVVQGNIVDKDLISHLSVVEDGDWDTPRCWEMHQSPRQVTKQLIRFLPISVIHRTCSKKFKQVKKNALWVALNQTKYCARTSSFVKGVRVKNLV